MVFWGVHYSRGDPKLFKSLRQSHSPQEAVENLSKKKNRALHPQDIYIGGGKASRNRAQTLKNSSRSTAKRLPSQKALTLTLNKAISREQENTKPLHYKLHQEAKIMQLCTSKGFSSQLLITSSFCFKICQLVSQLQAAEHRTLSDEKGLGEDMKPA